MWDGVSYVEPSYAPIVHEGDDPATVIINNAGPATVRVKAWNVTAPQGDRADVNMELRPGNTRSVSGRLIRIGIADSRDSPWLPIPPNFPMTPFAAIGWKIVR